MIGVVLAGGEGTRLRPFTALRPKPFVPVLGRPCIDYALDLFDPIGVRDVLVTTYFRPEQLIGHLRGGSARDMRIFYSIEDAALGTAGGVAKARRLLNETIIVVSGDLFVEADLTRLIEAHRRTGARATMALREVLNPVEYGIVGLDSKGRVTRFIEQPSPEEVFSNLINAGIYAIEADVLDMIPEGARFDFSRDLFPLLRDEGTLYGSELEGIWIDIGRPADLLRANKEAAMKRISAAGGSLSASGLVHPEARVEGEVSGASYLGPGAVVEREAKVRDSFLLDGVYVRQGATVEGSLVLEGTRIERDSAVHDTLIGSGCEISSQSRLEECVLGDMVVVPGGSWLVRQRLE